MKRIIFLALGLAATPASAQDSRTLTIVNDTSAAVNQLFVAGGRSSKLRAKVAGIFGAPDDDRDRLDAKMLPRGGSIVVTLKGGQCAYDIRAVLEDGRTYLGDDVDVCATGHWSIASGRRR